MLQRCLDKDPRRRFHDIADARIEIEDVMSGAAGTAADATTGQPGGSRSVAGVRCGGRGAGRRRRADVEPSDGSAAPTAPPRISRMTMASSGTAALGIANDRSLAITPDGTRVVYVGSNNQLFVRPLDRLDADRDLQASAAPLNWVFVSPDGQWVGFAEGRRSRRWPITGGPAVTIAQTDVLSGATWAPDDTIIFATTDPATGLRRVSASGGDVDVLTQPAQARGELDHLWPEMLPGGRAVPLYHHRHDWRARLLKWPCSTLRPGHTGSGAGRQPRALRPERAPGVRRRNTARGPVRPRPAGGRRDAGDGAAAAGDNAARRGRFRRRRRRNPRVRGRARRSSVGGRTLVWVDRQGGEEPGAPPRPYIHPRVSPDGARVAVAIEDQENDIWVWDLARRTLSRLTFDPAADFSRCGRPTGIIWSSSGSARPGGVFWQPADGTGAAERLSTGAALRPA